MHFSLWDNRIRISTEIGTEIVLKTSIGEIVIETKIIETGITNETLKRRAMKSDQWRTDLDRARWRGLTYIEMMENFSFALSWLLLQHAVCCLYTVASDTCGLVYGSCTPLYILQLILLVYSYHGQHLARTFRINNVSLAATMPNWLTIVDTQILLNA